MTASSPTRLILHRPHLSLRDRAFSLAAFVVAGAIFLTLGWSLMEPVDPQGAVSALTRGGGAGLIIKAALLGAATAAAATVVAGQRLADVGTFATGLGLMLVSLRGNNAAALLTSHASDGGSMRTLAVWMAFESLGWCLVMGVAAAVSGFVMSRLYGGPPSEPGSELAPGEREAHACLSAAWAMASLDVPKFSHRWFGTDEASLTPWRDGVRHMLIATGVAFAVTMILSAGVSSRAVRHGEACFMVAVAVFVGSRSAHALAPARSALWSLASVGVLMIFGCLYAAVSTDPGAGPAGVPASPFMRVLPLQFAAVGFAAAVLAQWSVQVRARAVESSDAATGPDARKRRTARRGGRG